MGVLHRGLHVIKTIGTVGTRLVSYKPKYPLLISFLILTKIFTTIKISKEELYSGDKGGRSSRPLDKEGGPVSKTFFGPLGPQFGLKISCGRAPRAPPLYPPL